MNAAEHVRRLLHDGALDLPPIGAGATRERWRRLAATARCDVATARLAEAHVDAVQILHEGGRRVDADCLLGVWASESRAHTVRAEPGRDGTLRLHGSKAFCSGAGIVDAALVTATHDDTRLLLLVGNDALDAGRIDTTSWHAHALRDTCTATVDLDGITVAADAVVGGPNWYLDRPGFWHGAIGPAACWAGAAYGLIDHVLAQPAGDAHARANDGALVAARWAMASILDAAGDEADRDPSDGAGAHERALTARYLIDETCRDVQDRFGRALGPRAFVADAALAERFEALTIYRRQCHAERDLEALGALPRAQPRTTG